MDSILFTTQIPFMIGCFTLNALYHFFLFILYKKNRRVLYFALINLAAFLFNLMLLIHPPLNEKTGSLIYIINPVLFVTLFVYAIALARRFSRAYGRCTEIVEERTRELTLANARMIELARLDPLTGLHNGRSFFEQAEHILNHSRRYGSDFSIVLLDVDSFKKVNDRYGHQTGDSVLKGLADTLAENVRSADLTGRHGGEEFVILLDQIDLEEAVQTSEKIRRKIEGMEFLDDEQNRISVTVSIGIAACEEGDPSVQALINRADEALTFSKNEGANCSSYKDRDGQLRSVAGV